MRGLLFFIVLAGCLLLVDWIATEGEYTRVAWSGAREEADFARHQMEYWVNGFGL